MEQYIGTKIVQAEPAYKLTGPGVNEVIPASECLNAEDVAGCAVETIEGVAAEEGYKVVYEGGYESWSPKEVFEKAYRRTDSMSFGLAIEAAKMGKKIARSGWNGRGQYVELGVDFDYCTINGEDGHAHHEDIGSRALVFVGTRGRQVGWLASQSDMLADDWYIVE